MLFICAQITHISLKHIIIPVYDVFPTTHKHKLKFPQSGIHSVKEFVCKIIYP